MEPFPRLFIWISLPTRVKLQQKLQHLTPQVPLQKHASLYEVGDSVIQSDCMLNDVSLLHASRSVSM